MDLSIKQALKLIKEDKDIIILDVRTEEEFNLKHLTRAINIDLFHPSFENKLNKLDKNKKYLVYCHSGNRSFQASKLMEKLGFKSIFNVMGDFRKLVL